MNNFVAWLDSKEAFIFSLKTSGTEKSHLKKDSVDHHHDQKKESQDNSKNADLYYQALAIRLKESDRLLLLGPGLAKTHFKSYLEAHHGDGLAKKIVGTETLEHVTENQILAAAHKFFKKYDLFNDSM